jgi:flagellar protein FlaG
MSTQAITNLPLLPPSHLTQNVGSASTVSSQRTVSESSQINTSTLADSTKTKPVDAQELESAVQKVQNFTQNLAKELQFDIDKGSGRTVVKVVDTGTKEVIRQIPSEEMLAMAKALDQIQGLLVKQKA